jgi:N-acetyl-alpha-D-glucosaminyl L-malate synthase BshA
MMLTERVVPFVTTLHGTDIKLVGNDRSYLPITRFGIEQSDAVTAVSEYLRRRTIEEFQVQRDVTVVPNFVDCDLYGRSTDANLRRKFADPDEGILIHISNFRPVKRVEDVIEIFSLVRKKTKAKLLMVGDGPERPKAEWLANTHGIGGDVLFLGKQNNMNEVLSISDILLLPSELESFGLVALEAMACEVPVVGAVCAVLLECLQRVADRLEQPAGQPVQLGPRQRAGRAPGIDGGAEQALARLDVTDAGQQRLVEVPDGAIVPGHRVK